MRNKALLNVCYPFLLILYSSFSAIIIRSKWFNAGGFNNKHFLAVFYIKLLFGVMLWYIYTHIYKNRITSDIFKYYQDSQILYASLHSSIKDYLTMLTGIGDSTTYYQQIYHTMNCWFNGYGTALYSNSHFIIRINSFFLLFSHGNYGVHVIFMCFISFIGFTYIYKAFLPYLQEKSKILFAAIFLFPSVVLWSSGILKEGFIWLGLGLSIYYFFQLMDASNKKNPYILLNILYVLIGFIILFESKAYILLCIFPGFIAHLLVKKIGYCKAHPLITYFSVLLLYVASSSLPHLFFQGASPFQMISDKQTDFNRLSRGGIYLTKIKDPSQYAFIPVTDSANIVPLNAWSDSLLHKRGMQYLVSNPFWYTEFKTKNKAPYMLRKGTLFSSFRIYGSDTSHLIATDSTAYCVCIYIEPAKSRVVINPIEPNIKSLLINTPQALKTSMLLPYPWQVHSAMTAIYCIENIFVLLLIFIALFFIKPQALHPDLVLFCLFYCLTMLILIGLVTPILGGIERYKSVVIPFIFILLLLVTKKNENTKMNNEIK